MEFHREGLCGSEDIQGSEAQAVLCILICMDGFKGCDFRLHNISVGQGKVLCCSAVKQVVLRSIPLLELRSGQGFSGKTSYLSVSGMQHHH